MSILLLMQFKRSETANILSNFFVEVYFVENPFVEHKKAIESLIGFFNIAKLFERLIASNLSAHC